MLPCRTRAATVVKGKLSVEWIRNEIVALTLEGGADQLWTCLHDALWGGVVPPGTYPERRSATYRWTLSSDDLSVRENGQGEGR